MRGGLLAAVLALAGIAAGAVAADGHANYVRSNPAADARLVKAPVEIRMSFSEPPDPRGSAITVLDESGARVDTADTAASGEPNGLRVGVKPVGDGGYTVAWTARSAVDGHETKGTFAYAVGNAALPSLADVPDASPPPSPLELIGRLLSYGGIALGIGTVLFVLVVRSPETAPERRREQLLQLVAGGLIVVGSAALLLDQGGRIPPRLGILLGLRAASGLALAAIALAPRPRLSLRREIAGAAAIVAALTATLVSHAAALGLPLGIVLDYVHVLAISAWTGGIVALLWIVLLGAPELTPLVLSRTVRRFSLLALVSVGLLVVTGTLQAFSRLVIVQDLVETPYGIALLVKIVLLGATLAFGAFHLLRAGPRGDRRALIRGTAAEIGLLAIVIAAAGVLTAVPPPAQNSGAAFDETRHVAGLRLELVLPTALPGRNRYVLRVHQGLQPLTDPQKVVLRFTMVEHDMGETELVTTQRAPGEYVADGSVTAMYGTWKVQAIIRRAGLEDVTTVFSVPINQSGTATAAALTAGPYQLVVFPEPAAPQAGAPITFNIVVVDQKGDPVSGKTVSGTVVGERKGPAPAPIAASQVSVGRYSITVDALEAGPWRLTIAIGSEGQADYQFTVAQ
ncbi:MAG TPA: copper resistance protein CopC [Candidatus Saccharimonadales bacterium]|nr:copper resistance protein CopC [Candidatus Saccharimonadales bacterium]